MCDKMALFVCPSCKGCGAVPCNASSLDCQTSYHYVTCEICKGTGKVYQNTFKEEERPCGIE